MAGTPRLPLLPLDALPGVTAGPAWFELNALRTLAGPGARPVGYGRGPDVRRPTYAFLAADLPDTGFRVARRSLVLLNGDGGVVLGAFDFVAPAPPGTRQTASVAPCIRCRTLLPRGLEPGDAASQARAIWQGDSEDATFLRAAWSENVPEPSLELLWSLSLAGFRRGHTVVLFHTGSMMARSSVHFDLEGPGKLEYLVTGLAPGTWEIWWNGWLEDPQGGVEPAAGTLWFEGPPGSYYVRRLS